jgi:DNA-binding NarL/FixJ family response regulator
MRSENTSDETKVVTISKREKESRLEISPRPSKGNEAECCNTFPQTNISIVIADSMAITSELLRQAFSQKPGFEISGCPRNLEELVELLSEKAPDIALIKSSDKKGMFTPFVILETIHNLQPSTRTIVLSSNTTREDIVAYFHAQARGILAADLTDFATLCRCIRSVHEGQIWASGTQLNYLIESLSGIRPMQIVNADGEVMLSAREQEVFRLLAEGRSNRAMAAVLNLSEHTIKNHLFHIFYKLGVSSRTEAILYGMRRRVLPGQKNAS